MLRRVRGGSGQEKFLIYVLYPRNQRYCNVARTGEAMRSVACRNVISWDTGWYSVGRSFEFRSCTVRPY